MSNLFVQLSLAFLTDIIIGDPKKLPHPVVWIGAYISFIEKRIRKFFTRPPFEFIAGAFLTTVVVLTTYFTALLFEKTIILLFSGITPFPCLYIHDFIIGAVGSLTIAHKGLIESVTKVSSSIGDLNTARARLGEIVGRDTKNLDQQSILKAAIETLSENASDGIIAPIFYFAIGGLPLAFAYKAINTIDSMIGYKNVKYKYFGRAGAKLDDIANYIPARITGALIVVSTFIIQTFRHIFPDKSKFKNSKNSPKANPRYINFIEAAKTIHKDGRKHTSPNAGVPEAAIAGATGVRLGGPSVYGGIVVDKPYIGSELNKDYSTALSNALVIIKVASLAGALIAVGSRLFIDCFI